MFSNRLRRTHTQNNSPSYVTHLCIVEGNAPPWVPEPPPQTFETLSLAFQASDMTLPYLTLPYHWLRTHYGFLHAQMSRERVMTVGSWLTRVINLTLHISLGFSNLKSTSTRIPQLAVVQIKTTIALKICMTSFQHTPGVVLNNNWHSYVPHTEIHRSCHREPFSQGRDAAKLCGWIGTSYISNLGPEWVMGLF